MESEIGRGQATERKGVVAWKVPETIFRLAPRSGPPPIPGAPGPSCSPDGRPSRPAGRLPAFGQLLGRNLAPFHRDPVTLKQRWPGRGPFDRAERPAAENAGLAFIPPRDNVPNQAILGGGGNLAQARLPAAAVLGPPGTCREAQLRSAQKRTGRRVAGIHHNAGR